MKTSQYIVRSEPDLAASLDLYWRRLAETIAWAQPRVDASDPRQCLRGSDSRPGFFRRSYFSTVNEAYRFRSTEAKMLPTEGFLAGGRLLVYFPDYDLCDGAAEAESYGFLDMHNAPPWDTWVALIEDSREKFPFLVAWVPPLFISHASAGIEVNPEECVQWLDQSKLALARALLNRAG